MEDLAYLPSEGGIAKLTELQVVLPTCWRLFFYSFDKNPRRTSTLNKLLELLLEIQISLASLTFFQGKKSIEK